MIAGSRSATASSAVEEAERRAEADAGKGRDPRIDAGDHQERARPRRRN